MGIQRETRSDGSERASNIANGREIEGIGVVTP
jgi:hypothetical protein